KDKPNDKDQTKDQTNGKDKVTDGKPADKVVMVEEISNAERVFHSGDYHVQLMKLPDSGWWWGKFPTGDMSPLKVHINTSGAEDLGKLQAALIEKLEKDPILKENIVGWKTMDPLFGTEGEGRGVKPTGEGQKAKAFTLYLKDGADETAVAKRLDAILK